MFRKSILLIILVCLMSRTGIAQDYTFAEYGQNEGLDHTQVLDICQDSNGNLWLGTTTQSIYRFDGKRFYQYKVSIPEYTGTILTFKILADGHNNILILTNQGLLRFDGLRSVKIPQNATSVVESTAKLFKDKHEGLWLIDDKGKVFQMKDDTLRQRLDIMESLGGKAAGYYYKENDLRFFSYSGKVMAMNEAGQLAEEAFPWSGTNFFGVYRSQDSDVVSSLGKVEEYFSNKKMEVLLPPPFNKYLIKQIVKDRNGLIWVLVANKIFVVDKGDLHQISGTPNMPGNYSNCLFKDSNGDVWISVDGEGIFKYKKYSWRKQPETRGKDITSVLELPDDGGLVFGTYANGIIGWDKPLLNGLPVTSLAAINSTNALAGTLEGGLFIVSKNSSSRVNLSKASVEYVHGVAVDNNVFIAGTHLGLFIVDGKLNKNYRKIINGRIAPITNPVVNGSEIFCAGMSAGLMKISGDSLINIGPEFLNKSTIYNIKRLPDGGFVVTGEFSKMLFFDNDFKFDYSIELKSFVSNVLISEFLNASTAIIGSNDGLFKMVFKGDSIMAVKKYGKADGYGGEEFYGGSSTIRNNGEILIGTVDGAYSFNPKNEEVNLTPSMVYLTGVDWINDEMRKKSTDAVDYFQIPTSPQLLHNQNSITFSFDYSNLNNPNNIKFHHRLVGVEKDWSPTNNAQQVTYSNLSPGTYTFNVQAIGEDKIFGAIKQYQFTIVPAFWQTPLFYLLLFFLLVALVILITQLVSRYKINKHKLETQIRVEESVKIRKQMSMDFHDEMGNKLAGMLAQASFLKFKYKEGELVDIFDYFERNAYAIFHSTKDFIWTIDVNSNNLKEVISYLRDFGCQFFERHDITFHVEDNILDDAFDKQLPDGYNRHIILIFKEAMTNALKHARCQNVFFSVRREVGTYEIAFADDGIWKNDLMHGNGLKNMQHRAEKIKSNLSIGNKDGRTTIALSIKTMYL